MSSVVSEIEWLVRLLNELGVTNLKPVMLHFDNQSTMYIANNPVFHDRSKHIAIDYCHFTQEKVLKGLVQMSFLLSKLQLEAFSPSLV